MGDNPEQQFEWALKNGDMDQVKSIVEKVIECHAGPLRCGWHYYQSGTDWSKLLLLFSLSLSSSNAQNLTSEYYYYYYNYYVNKVSRQTRDYKRRIYSETQTS